MERAVLAALIGAACAVAVLVILWRVPQYVAKDFTYPWRAAQALLAGQNPYEVIQPISRYPFESRFPYPLPAAVAAIPFAAFTPAVGAAIFFGVSTAALAWALLGELGGVRRLIVLAGAPFCMALSLAQWGPLLLLGALLPAFAWTLSLKPTLGLALFAWRPSWQAIVGGATLGLIAMIWVPRWPVEWVQAATHTTGHPAFVTQPFGWLPLLALIRWRDPDARLVALLACVPQNPYFYDQLPLALVARGAWSGTAFAALSWIAFFGTRANCTDPNFCGPESVPWVIWLLYVPATAFVLLRGRDLRTLGRRALTSGRLLSPPAREQTS